LIINLSALSKDSVYHTLTQVIVPRPVAWVLSEHANGKFNLAPFSYFSAVCSDPPIVMISVGKKPDGSEKDTYKNIVEREHFVIHIAGADMASAVTQSSMVLPAGESELEICQLATENVEGFNLPRVVGAPIAMSCRLYQHSEIGNSGQKMVLGEIEKIWIDEDVLSYDDKGRMKVLPARLNPLGRLGGIEYGVLGEILRIPRPS